MGTALLLVDDHQFTRLTLGNALAGRGYEVHAVSGVRAALALLDDPTAPACEVAILDLDLGPGPTGLDLALEVRRRVPEIGIVLLTSYREPRLAAQHLPALPTGGVFLCKDDVDDLDTLLGIIELVRHRPVATRPQHTALRGSSPLTDVQVAVLAAIGEGATTAQIAADRGVSAGAVEKTIARICDRLGIPRDPQVNQRVQLVHAYNQLRGLR